MITSRLLPPEDPVEAVFKPPESLPHSYLPKPPPHAASALSAPVSLKLPKALQRVGREASFMGGTGGPHTEELDDPTTAGAPVSYQKVRRWDMLPKHAWLQAAESGHAPGPGFRDVSASQTMRSYGPKGGGLPPVGYDDSSYDAAAASHASKSSMSTSIASNYSPLASGLVTAALHMGLQETNQFVPLSEKEPEQPIELIEDESASTFLPLEFFDGGEMEPMPDSLWEDAETLFLQGKPFGARSKFYQVGGTDALLPCEVVRYHPEDGKFEVQWVHTGKRKLCTRLNLLFDDESESKFHERVAAAKEMRARFEAEARYYLFLTEQVAANANLSDVSAVLDEEALKRRVVGDDEAMWQGEAMYESLMQLHDDYNTAMQRSTADYQMLDKALRSKVAPLRLPDPVTKTVSEKGTIDIPAHDYAASRAAVEATLFQADQTVSKCIKLIHDESFWLRETTLIVSDAGQLDTPYKLELFLQVQAAKLEEIKARLNNVWIPAVEAHIQQELSATPDFEKAVEMNVYESSRVPRILKQIALLMQDELRSLVLTTMGAYLEFIKTYSTPASDLEIEPSVWVHDLPLAMPALLAVTLKLDGTELKFEPPLDEVVASLNQVLEAFVAQTRGVPQVGSHVMHMLALPEETLTTLEENDVTLQATRTELNAMLASSIIRPKQLMGVYEEYAELVGTEIDAHLATIKSKKYSLEQYSEEINKWRQMGTKVSDATPPEVHCRLLRVACGELKVSLATKAEAIARGVAGLVVEELQNCADKMGGTYEAIFNRLQSNSGSAEAVIEMNAYLQSCEIEMEKLKNGLESDLEARLALLALVGQELPDECFTAVYTTLGWPGRVYKVADDATKKQEEDKNHFMEELRNDKERFGEELEEWEVEIKALSSLGDMAMVEENAGRVQALQAKIDDGKERGSLYNSREELFGFGVTEYPQLNELHKALEPYNSLWTTAINFQRAYPTWLEGPFMELSPEQVEADVGNWFRQLYKLGKSLAHPGPQKVVAYVKEKIEEFKAHLPLISAMLNPGMRDRHWKGLADTLGKPVQPNEMSTLASLIEQNVGDYIEQIQEASDAASKEYSLEKALDKMLNEWKPMEFDCMEYRDTGTYILRALDDIQTLFDDHIVKTQAMRSSPFVKPFEQRCRDWEAKLISMQEIIDEWLKCQSVWLYLEPIFSSEDIMRQMPQEAKRFKQVDNMWRKVMQQTESKPNVLMATATEGMHESFVHANQLLELIQKGLNDYLEAKRLSFAVRLLCPDDQRYSFLPSLSCFSGGAPTDLIPHSPPLSPLLESLQRLFFLSNDELLQILSETKDPTKVQPHLKKCFEGINKLTFDDKLIIHAMESVEGEKVPFNATLDPNAANGMVEKWLLEVEGMMKESVSGQMQKTYHAYTSKPRVEWVLDWIGMGILAVDQIYWTRETEHALDTGGNKGLKAYEDQCTKQLDDMVMLVRTPISKLQRYTLGAMVTLDVHGRDVLTFMVQAGVEAANDFNWVSQLRYYYDPNGEDGVTKGPDLFIKIITSTAKYGWEYLGNSFRLVVTGLTDRCYRTLMSALQLTLGGAPEGPAGTGKTETTKDLAKALAKQCVVFNCSDGLDYLAMAKFFKGLAASGAWACFDEFNRIDLEVLSVVAQQVLTIQRAIAAGVKRFVFEGTDLPIDPTNAAFITMNPGYAGRSELPDNLKALFRPVRAESSDRPCLAPSPPVSFILLPSLLYLLWLI